MPIKSASFKLSCVLFDLDGTLVDTAPDLIACMNKAFVLHGFVAVKAETVRPYISYGAPSMIEEGLKALADKSQQMKIHETMLDLYQSNIAEHSVFFEGMTETLDMIEDKGLKWGVVTNKRERFTKPLMKALNLHTRAAASSVAIQQLTASRIRNPCWQPVNKRVSNLMNAFISAMPTIDISAGKSARMKTLAALYGYLKPEDKPETWGADGLIKTPQQISGWIAATLCL